MSIPGHDICDKLKEIRREIARRNGINLIIPECTYKGECAGTCPKCESEVRFLESELQKIENPVIDGIGVYLLEGFVPLSDYLLNSDNQNLFLDQINKKNHGDDFIVAELNKSLDSLLEEYQTVKDSPDASGKRKWQIEEGIRNIRQTLKNLQK